MTDKEIIIDGVDVSGCKYVEDCLPSADCTLLCGFCSEFKNCYYKQLQHKEQELKTAKEAYEVCLANKENRHKKEIECYKQAIERIEKVLDKTILYNGFQYEKIAKDIGKILGIINEVKSE